MNGLPDFADFWLKNIKDASIKTVLLSKNSDPIFMAGVGRRDVCLAGLFHAIYGIEFYIEMALNSTKEDHRRRLALAIGTDAEKLTYLYGTHNEGKIFIKNDLAKLGDKVISNFRTGEESRITQDIFSDFADILVANGDEPLERALSDSRFMFQNSESLKKFGSFMPLALHLHEEAKVVLGIIQKVLSS